MLSVSLFRAGLFQEQRRREDKGKEKKKKKKKKKKKAGRSAPPLSTGGHGSTAHRLRREGRSRRAPSCEVARRQVVDLRLRSVRALEHSTSWSHLARERERGREKRHNRPPQGSKSEEQI